MQRDQITAAAYIDASEVRRPSGRYDLSAADDGVLRCCSSTPPPPSSEPLQSELLPEFGPFTQRQLLSPELHDSILELVDEEFD